MQKEKTDFEQVFERLASLDIITQRELAKILDITPSAVSCAKRGGKFPRGWAEILSQKLNISFDFLLFGKYKVTSNDELIDRLLESEKRNTELKQVLKHQELLLVQARNRPLQSLSKFTQIK